MSENRKPNHPLDDAPTTAEILAARGPRNRVSMDRAYASLREPEYSRYGTLDDVVTVFLTNRECPFRCLMCDLWKNTLTESVVDGAIVRQVDQAISELGTAAHLKLYNSGNFFDLRAIPIADRLAVRSRLRGFTNLIVENHPRFCGDECLRFRDGLDCDLEIAIGLETIHPDVLPRLNKQMTPDDFSSATRRLTASGIAVRAFILLRPPWLNESEGVEWAIRSIEFAFDCGVDCCAVIPTRPGNGIMEILQQQNLYAPPQIQSLESVVEAGLRMARGRVLADVWDIEFFSNCSACLPDRRLRLQRFNSEQNPDACPPVVCPDCSGSHEIDRS